MDDTGSDTSKPATFSSYDTQDQIQTLKAFSFLSPVRQKPTWSANATAFTHFADKKNAIFLKSAKQNQKFLEPD